MRLLKLRVFSDYPVGECDVMGEERFVELSRTGHEPLEFAVADITPQSVASAFDVS